MNEVIYNPLHFIGRKVKDLSNLLVKQYFKSHWDLFLVNGKHTNQFIIYLKASLEGVADAIIDSEEVMINIPLNKWKPEHLQYTLYLSNGKIIFFKYYYNYNKDHIDFIQEYIKDWNLPYTDNRICTYE